MLYGRRLDYFGQPVVQGRARNCTALRGHWYRNVISYSVPSPRHGSQTQRNFKCYKRLFLGPIQWGHLRTCKQNCFLPFVHQTSQTYGAVPLSPQAVAGAIFNSRLLSSGEVGVQLSSATSASIDLRALAVVEPIELRQEMLRIVTYAIQVSRSSRTMGFKYTDRAPPLRISPYGLFVRLALVSLSWYVCRSGDHYSV